MKRNHLKVTGEGTGNGEAIAEKLYNGGGAIVNMSSANGLVGLAGMSAYTTAKHGVIGLTKGSRKNKFTFLALRYRLGLEDYKEQKAQ